MKENRIQSILSLAGVGTLGLCLLACTNAQPTASITSLDGLGLLGPQSIASTSLEGKGYVTMAGQCSSLVQRVEVSAQLNTGETSSWYAINPLEAPISGEATPSAEGVIFDQDCADGKFLVYLFRHNFNSWFASGSTAGKDNISQLYLRGILADGTGLSKQNLKVDSCGTTGTKYDGEFFCHTLCGAGQWYNHTSHICENVGLGFYSAANDDSRTACAAGSFTSTATSASASECVVHHYKCLGLACGMNEPGNHYGKSGGNYSMISTAGSMNRDLVKKSSGGYKLFTTTKGILFSPR